MMVTRISSEYGDEETKIQMRLKLQRGPLHSGFKNIPKNQRKKEEYPFIGKQFISIIIYVFIQTLVIRIWM